MLVLGNLLGKKYLKSIESKTVEVIHTGKTEKKVKRELKLFGLPLKKTTYSQHYMKGRVHYVLHNADSIFVLKWMLQENFCNDGYKAASPFMQYAWSKVMSGFEHKDIGDWVDTCLLHSRLHKNFFAPTITPELFLKATELATRLKHIAGEHPLVERHTTIFNDFDLYTRRSMLEFYSIGKGSLYHSLLVKPDNDNKPMFRDYLNRSVWEKLNRSQKIEAVLERIYADVANEELLDAICRGDNMSVYDETKLLYKYLMIAACEKATSYFSNFIINNLEDILGCADLGYIEFTVYAIQNDEFIETSYT
tara:strand:+ start:9250 stop:10170 length:921 start_codon:yes stop_codon:yes gene_type:complete